MKKILIGLTLVTALATTTGLAAAQNNGNGNGNANGYTKDQCKDGGWQELGFRNQGECVSFFARQQHSISNVNDVDVTTSTEQFAEGASVHVEGSTTGNVSGGDASNTSIAEVGVSVSN